MSAGGGLPAGLKEYRGTDCLAPRFRVAVEHAIQECHARGYDVTIWETCRSQALQEFYYQRGRPPTPEFPRPVTYVRNAMKGWHFYGLAVDVISRSHGWFNQNPAEGQRWFLAVAEIFIANGCDWGGSWVKRDTPHMQWGLCRPSPSQVSIDAFTRGGKAEVWRLVKAA